MKADAVGSTGGGGSEDYILIRDEKPSGTGGGTFTSGAWQTRTLNTEVNDAGGHAALSSNQITLAAGTYRVKASAPAFKVEEHKIKLYSVSDAANIIIGSSEYAPASSNGQTRSSLEGRFTLATSKIIELQHRCAATFANRGFGLESGFGVVEVYATIEFWKEA